MSTNPNQCPLCGSTPRVRYDEVACENPYCPLVEVWSFTPAEWAKLTEGKAERARADKAVEALRAIDTAVGKALEGLK